VLLVQRQSRHRYRALALQRSAEVAHGILTRSVDFVFDGPSAVLPLIQSGDMRALAKLDGRPFPPVADLPTLVAATGVDLAISPSGSVSSRRAARRVRSSTSSMPR